MPTISPVLFFDDGYDNAYVHPRATVVPRTVIHSSVSEDTFESYIAIESTNDSYRILSKYESIGEITARIHSYVTYFGVKELYGYLTCDGDLMQRIGDVGEREEILEAIYAHFCEVEAVDNDATERNDTRVVRASLDVH